MRTLAPTPAATTRSTQRVLTVIAAGVFALFFVFLVVVWRHTGPVGVDDVLVSARHPGAVMRRLAFLGSPEFIFTALLAVATVAYAARDHLAVVLCAVGPALGGVGELIAKPVVHRLKDNALSYPSGHVTLAAGFGAVLVIVCYRLGGARAAAVAAVPATVLTLVVSAAVVRVGWHYPTDAIGGFGLGVGAVCAVAAVLTARVGAGGRWR